MGEGVMIVNEDAIREAISASVYKTIGEGAAVSVDVEFLDDIEPMKDVVTVRVITHGDVDHRAVANLGLTLRKTLSDLDDDHFPLVSIISKGEFDRRHR